MIVDLQVDVENAEGVRLDPNELVEGAKAAGLDGVLLTHGDDFDVDVSAYREAAAESGLTILRGAKVESDHGVILCVLPDDAQLAEDWAAKEEGLYDAHAVIDAIEAKGGVSIALRPYDRDVAHPMGDHVFSLQGLTACEVVTGGLSDIANDLALEAASNLEMPCVGSSGNHGVSGFGTAATLLRSPVESESELCDAIRTGDCWPVTFTDTVPKAPASEERSSGGGRSRGRGRGRGGRDGGRDGGREGGREGRRDGGGGREGRDGGGRGRGGRSRGGRGRGRGGGGGGGDDRGNRRRGGGRSGPRPDDIGNRAPNQRRTVAEDIGNRVRPEEQLPHLAEDLGNRLKPGQNSPYRGQPEPLDHGPDIDDDIGNR